MVGQTWEGGGRERGKGRESGYPWPRCGSVPLVRGWEWRPGVSASCWGESKLESPEARFCITYSMYVYGMKAYAKSQLKQLIVKARYYYCVVHNIVYCLDFSHGHKKRVSIHCHLCVCMKAKIEIINHDTIDL